MAALVMWWGAPGSILPVLPKAEETPLLEPSDPDAIQIAWIEAPAEEPPLPPEPELTPEAEPIEPEAEEPEPPEAPSLPPQEEATQQLESDLPEAFPPPEELPEPLPAAEPADLPAVELTDAEPAELEPAEPEPAEPMEIEPEAVAPADAPPDAVAALQELSAPEASPQPGPRPEPEPASTPEPVTEPVDDVSIAIGRYRIEQGRYPHQRASYARIGFERYRDAMLALGGGFYLFDTRAKRVVAELDPFTLDSRPTDRAPGHLSRWPRDVSRYLGAALSPGQLDRRYDARSLRVVLLPPSEIDAAFVGGLDRALRREGIDIESVTQVRLIYELTNAGLRCEVAKVELRDGTEKPMKLRLALSGPIPNLRQPVPGRDVAGERS